jgi:hypothetical protein
MHQSDVICSSIGWLKEASQSMEYRKNYEGYWNGELFVKQVWLISQLGPTVLRKDFDIKLKEKIIPMFEKYHNKEEFRAVIMVNNLQGHSAYPKDAL